MLAFINLKCLSNRSMFLKDFWQLSVCLSVRVNWWMFKLGLRTRQKRNRSDEGAKPEKQKKLSLKKTLWMSGFFPGNRMTYFLSLQTVDKAEEGPIKSRTNLVTFVPSAFFLLSVRCNKKQKNEKWKETKTFWELAGGVEHRGCVK